MLRRPTSRYRGRTNYPAYVKRGTEHRLFISEKGGNEVRPPARNAQQRRAAVTSPPRRLLPQRPGAAPYLPSSLPSPRRE